MLRRQIVVQVIMAALIAACGTGSTPIQPKSATSTENPVANKWADSYGGPITPVTFSDEEDALWKEITGRKGPTCVHDPRLTRVARQYASALSASLSRHNDGDLDWLRFTLLKKGAPDYLILPLVAHPDKAGIESLIQLIDRSQTDWSHCGIGVAGLEPKRRAVWIGINRMVALDPLPTTAAPGSNVLVGGRVLMGSNAPVRTFVGHPDGSVTKYPQVKLRKNGHFQTSIPFDKTGRYEIELLVDAGRGPETAILVPIFVGVPPDPRPIVAQDPRLEQSGHSPGETLFTYLETARRRLGLPPLERDPRLDKVARVHSQEMATRGFFGHVSPYRGTLDRRLAKGGLFPKHSAENVARSRSLLRIHRNLMSSPSHRINALSPKYTRVGIGTAMDGDDVIATEIFACW
ncbi:MAG: CAP domain-containing protein [Proteobacteria bacterium]|nr:CAP domain-containing protein [Pseudomonadota bacterium]